MLLRSCCTAWVLLSGIAAAAAVFVHRHQANTVLQRWRRANSGFLEEMQQGNLERECIEETCDYEEAREVFEDVDQTNQFWATYNRHGPCVTNPCRNNGTCVSTETSYLCVCPDGFVGPHCENLVELSLKCLYHNGQCQHFCDGSGETQRCFCADGYKLGADGRKCIAEVEFPCGQLAPQEVPVNQSVVGQTRLVGANHCPKGECPWQVLVQLHGHSHCGGVLINPDWVITAAHCLHGNKPEDFTVVAGEHNLDVEEGTEQRIPVSMAITHEGYVPEMSDNDLALLKLNRSVTLNRHAIPICLPTKDFATQELLQVRYHTVSGWGKRTIGGNKEQGAVHAAPLSPILSTFSVPIIQNSRCAPRAQLNLTNDMLCAGYLEGTQQSCRGDDGSPLVTVYGSTHFLTGVVAWGRGCFHPGYYGVYTNMANFVGWVEGTVTRANEKPAEKAAVTAFDMLEQKVV